MSISVGKVSLYALEDFKRSLRADIPEKAKTHTPAKPGEFQKVLDEKMEVYQK